MIHQLLHNLCILLTYVIWPLVSQCVSIVRDWVNLWHLLSIWIIWVTGLRLSYCINILNHRSSFFRYLLIWIGWVKGFLLIHCVSILFHLLSLRHYLFLNHFNHDSFCEIVFQHYNFSVISILEPFESWGFVLFYDLTVSSWCHEYFCQILVTTNLEIVIWKTYLQQVLKSFLSSKVKSEEITVTINGENLNPVGIVKGTVQSCGNVCCAYVENTWLLVLFNPQQLLRIPMCVQVINWV